MLKYTQKGVKYGAYIEIYKYYHPKYVFKQTNRTISGRTGSSSRNDFSVRRTKQNVYRICKGNIGRHGQFKPVFFTLTFAAAGKDLNESNREFKYFIARLQYSLDLKMKYLAVPEVQTDRLANSGNLVWHYHGVFFNLPKIPILKFKKIWSHGSVDLQTVKKIKNVASYISSYITEESAKHLKGKKAYFTSRGLIRPIHSLEQEVIETWLIPDNIDIDFWSNSLMEIKTKKYVKSEICRT